MWSLPGLQMPCPHRARTHRLQEPGDARSPRWEALSLPSVPPGSEAPGQVTAWRRGIAGQSVLSPTSLQYLPVHSQMNGNQQQPLIATGKKVWCPSGSCSPTSSSSNALRFGSAPSLAPQGPQAGPLLAGQTLGVSPSGRPTLPAQL